MNAIKKQKTAFRIYIWGLLILVLLAEAIIFAWPTIRPGRNRESDLNLINACSTGNLAYVNILLALGADPMTSHYIRGFALTTAVMGSQPKVVGRLLSSGADVDACDPYSRETPLMMAVQLDNASMVRYLLSKSADPNIKKPPRRISIA